MTIRKINVNGKLIFLIHTWINNQHEKKVQRNLVIDADNTLEAKYKLQNILDSFKQMESDIYYQLIKQQEDFTILLLKGADKTLAKN